MSGNSEEIDFTVGSLFVSVIKKDEVSQQRLFEKCEASVRKTSDEFQDELVITRIGESQGEIDSFLPSDLIFKIDESAQLESQGESLGWSDRDQKRFNFEAEDEEEANILQNDVAKALFKSIHSAHPGKEDEQELKNLLSPPTAPELPDMKVIARDLLTVAGDLLKYDEDREVFIPMIDNVVVRIDKAVHEIDQTQIYVMIVESEDGATLFTCEVNNDMNMQFFSRTTSFVWILDPPMDDESDDPPPQICLSVKLNSEDEFLRFRETMSAFFFEVNHQATIDDLKLSMSDRAYVEDSYRDDIEPMEIVDDEDNEEENRQVKDVLDKDRASVDNLDDGFTNSKLAISANNDRTFVVRGSKMGVFSTADDGAQFKTMLKFKDPRTGNIFTPSNVLLHEKDTSMIVLDPNDETSLMRMDLERGEIVDKWSGNLTSNIPVQTVHRTSKYSNLTDTKEFVGLNKNQLLRMDPRTNEFIVQSKRYAPSTRARLDCMATTGAGYIAVASENGDIRLYDQIGKNAKTHLPGIGPGIIGMDVSENGDFILATTAKYLLLIDTRLKDDDKNRIGFQKSLGKNKPAPRKLTIRNEDIVKYRMGEINFTTAHFNTGSSLERSIVTSTGPFIVVWNFRSVKLGRLNSYKIKRYQDNIVADDFTYNDDGRIVVTLPNDVSVARR